MPRFFSSAWFKIGFAVVVLACLFGFNRLHVDSFVALAHNWPWLVLALVLMLPPYAIVSYRFLIVLRNQGIPADVPAAIRWTMIGSFFDVVMPSNSGGDLIKCAYVVRAAGPGKRLKAVMAVAFDRILGLLGLFLLAGLACMIGWRTVRSIPDAPQLVAFIVLVSVGSLVTLRVLGARGIYGNAKLRGWLAEHPIGARILGVVGCFNSLREKPGDLWAVLGLSMLNHVFWCAALLCVTIAFDQDIDVLVGFTVFPLAIFSNVFGFAGGFGVGTAAFDVIFTRLLDIHVGAAIGLTFQTLSALSRLSGLPFYVAAPRIPDAGLAESR
jgi:uncharacterized membrane protein YbhN (UPF0104 family)